MSGPDARRLTRGETVSRANPGDGCPWVVGDGAVQVRRLGDDDAPASAASVRLLQRELEDRMVGGDAGEL